MLVLPDSSTRVTAASYPAFQAETSYVPAGTSIVATPAPSVAALNAPTRTWTSSSEASVSDLVTVTATRCSGDPTTMNWRAADDPSCRDAGAAAQT